jgi:cell division protein FtsQ
MASQFTADVGRIARTFPRAALSVPRAVSRPFTRRRVVIAVLLLVALCAGYFFWFRDSSLVAVDQVEVSGVSYAEEEITASLTSAAEKMTTLNADPAELERAVEKFPTVASLAIDPAFPHELSITVTERHPVARMGPGEGVAVAGDGTVLSGVPTGDVKLPAIEVNKPPSSGRLDGVALAQAEVLGATPGPLRPATESAGVDGDDGIVVNLVEGIEIRFGDSSDAAAKWAAAAAILADTKLDQLSYIDVRLPSRPAVGGAPIPESSTADTAPTEVPAVPVDPAATDPAATATAPVDPATATADPAAAPPPADTAEPAPAPAPTAQPAPATGVAGGAAAP